MSKINSYNNNRYINVVTTPAGNFWWDNLLQQIVPLKTIQSMVLTKDNVILECGVVCVGAPINCCDDALLANNLDCLFTNEYDCIAGNG